jgi:hypothetical protein
MDSLVSQTDVIAHLRLLGAMHSHLLTLSKGHVRFIEGVPRPTREGKLLFRRSVHRLKLWIVHVLRPKFMLYGSNQGLTDSEIPPLDVLVMLHGYMLHPRAFYEDTIRIHPELAVLNGFPFSQVVGSIMISYSGQAFISM